MDRRVCSVLRLNFHNTSNSGRIIPGSHRHCRNALTQRPTKNPTHAPPLKHKEPPRFPKIITTDWSKYSRRTGVMGRKVGMLHFFTDDGIAIPATAIVIERNHVITVDPPQLNTTTGCWSLHIGAGFQRPSRVAKNQRFHCAKAGVETKERYTSFQVTADAVLPIGHLLSVEHFVAGQKVDVLGRTRGKGFQGVMKRWGFKGHGATLGSRLHRVAGSIGSKQGVLKGRKMAGNMGANKRCSHNLPVLHIDAEKNVMFVKGSVVGPAGCWVKVRDSKYNRFRMMREGPRPPFPTFLGEVSPKLGDDVLGFVPPPNYDQRIATFIENDIKRVESGLGDDFQDGDFDDANEEEGEEGEEGEEVEEGEGEDASGDIYAEEEEDRSKR